MQDYHLVLRQSAGGEPETISLQAESAANALAIAHQRRGYCAELWQDGRRLCRMTYAPQGFWTVEAEPHRAP